jgi:MerR family Zn(II)-responsive transcriptional regulator of zntA
MASEYKIGDVAAFLGTTIRTIRYYEEEGLLQPLRTEGGTRLYNERHIARLKSILYLAENGFSLESIRLIGSIRETCKTGDESSKKVSAQLDGEIKVISARVRELERLKVKFAQTKTLVRKCRGCRNKPTSEGCPICPVKAHVNSVELLNLIWDQCA